MLRSIPHSPFNHGGQFLSSTHCPGAVQVVVVSTLVENFVQMFHLGLYSTLLFVQRFQLYLNTLIGFSVVALNCYFIRINKNSFVSPNSFKKCFKTNNWISTVHCNVPVTFKNLQFSLYTVLQDNLFKIIYNGISKQVELFKEI